ncbi:uncharacterized protein LOC134842918 [Symsagittifera roscoffensis]|uniref:uncharacterized protein LOC134842918 n=1 Tax=Symsagittifera roscoffensis TaxID=84072 RepID=UPI00307B10E0
MTPANVLGMFSCSISRRVACVPTDQVEMCENSAKVPLSDEILQLDSADNNDDIVYFVSSQACSDRHAAPFDHSTELLINLHNFHDELQRAATAAKPEGSFESGIVVKVQELCLFLKAMSSSKEVPCPNDESSVINLCQTNFFASSQIVRLSASNTFCTIFKAHSIHLGEISGPIQIAMKAMSCSETVFKVADEHKVIQFSSDNNVMDYTVLDIATLEDEGWMDHAFCKV